MRFYECILIIYPSVPEEEIDNIIDMAKEMITSQKGEILKLDKWGKRKLAYDVKKERYGFYVFMYFKALPGSIKDMERKFKLHEKILRHMIVNVEEKPVEETKPVAINENTETKDTDS